jgi:hypothetical protein
VRTNRGLQLLILFLLLVLCLACGSGSTGPRLPAEDRELTVQGDYRHPSGMVFPERLGDFYRTSVHQFPGSKDNVGISYQMGLQKTATVTAYVYPDTGESLRSHFSRVLDEVRQAHHAEPGNSSEVSITTPAGPVTGRMASFSYSEAFAGGPATELDSRVYLFKHGPWFVKYRVTGRAQDAQRVGEAVTTLMTTLGFPPEP